MRDRIINSMTSSIQAKSIFSQNESNIELLETIAKVCIVSIMNGGKILFCGNGGSAADAQHLAAELSGRFAFDREPIYAEALHVNSSFLTAVSNDYHYDYVFSRMIKAAGRKNDIIVGISTSGKSKNIYNALDVAKEMGMIAIAFTGANESPMAEIANYCVKYPSVETPRIQEGHIMIGHIICDIIEHSIFAS